jgi:hypothetical protein
LGIDVPVEGAEGKNYTSGLMLYWISGYKNGRYVKEEWEPLLEGSRLVHFRAKTNSLHYFPYDVKRRKLYFADNVPAK